MTLQPILQSVFVAVIASEIKSFVPAASWSRPIPCLFTIQLTQNDQTSDSSWCIQVQFSMVLAKDGSLLQVLRAATAQHTIMGT
jgi:hypothetical protein